MAVPSNPSLQDVVNEFGGPGDLRSYYRGGPYVPNVGQNAAVSTDPNQLALSQFVGATHYTPPVLGGPADVYWDGYNVRPPVKFSTQSGTTVSGGNAATSIGWSLVSGGSITCATPNVVNATFSDYGGLYPNEEINHTAIWRLTYSDGITTVTKDVTFNFSSI